MTLYHCNQLPLAWVCRDAAGDHWIVPARALGWDDRTPYRGPVEALRQVDDAQAPVILAMCGAPSHERVDAELAQRAERRLAAQEGES